MENKRMLTGILIDPELNFFGARIVEDSLDSFYKLLRCSCIDIVTRTVGGTPVTIVCDDEAMLKDDLWLSAVSPKHETMLVGALFIVSGETDDGDLRSLSEADQRKVLACARRVRDGHGRKWQLLTEVEYA